MCRSREFRHHAHVNSRSSLFCFRNVTMPPPPRHRVSTSARPSATTPMSERQQMALLMQMTSSSEAGKSNRPKQCRCVVMTICCLILELSPNSQTVKPKDRNERGETALHICAKKGDLEAAKKLLESGVSPNVTDFAGKRPTCSHNRQLL